MQLNKIVDEKIRRLLDYDKSMNISAQDLKRVDVLSLANEPIKTLGDIANMTNLKELEISGTLINDISPLQYTPDLEVFASYDNELNDYSVLSQLNHLRELYLNQPLSKQDEAVIGLIKSLNVLSLDVSHGHIDFLKNLPDLKVLQVLGESIDLDGIGYLSNLERLIIDSKDVKGIEYLKGLANLKEVIFLHIHKEQKQAIESYGIKVNHTEEDIYPAFISEIGNFKLSSGMKSDASDIFKALNLIWAIIICVLILIFIFNDKALRPIWEPLTMIGLGYLFMPVTFGLWFYFLDFELEMTKDQLIIQRVWGVQKLDINAIETATFKEPNMKVSTIKIKTHKKTYRLVNSVFASPKSIRVFKKRLEEKGIKIINK